MRKVLLVLFVLLPTLVFADSLEEKEAKKTSEETFTNDLKSHVPGPCKATITGSLDWSTWKSATSDNPKSKGATAGGHCAFVSTALGALCRSSETAQQTIAKDIKTVTCDGDAADAHTYEMKGTNLVVHINFKNQPRYTDLVTWLEKNLQ